MGKAEDYYTLLREENRNLDGSPKDQYMLPMREFVMRDLRDAAAGFKDFQHGGGRIDDAFPAGVGRRECGDGRRCCKLCQGCVRLLQKDALRDPTQRRQLKKLTIIRRDVVDRFLRDPNVPLISK